MSVLQKGLGIPRIGHIDTWRFFAVVLVIQSHLFLFSGINLAWIETYSLQLDRLGEMGVLIFFVISGYVICSGLLAERAKTGSVCLWAFYARRFFRIMPPLWLYLATLCLLASLDRLKITGLQALTSFGFMCNLPFPDGCSWYAGHTWSLAYEEQFYLLFPLLFLFVAFINRSLHFAGLILALVLASWLCRFSGWVFVADYLGYFVFLLTGCWAAFLPPAQMAIIRRLPLGIWLAVLGLLLACLVWLPLNPEKYVKTLAYPGLIVLLVLGTPTAKPLVAGIFNNPGLCYLGRISYSVYLWQQLATIHYQGWYTALNIALVFGFAMLSFRYFEQPMQTFGRNMSAKLKQTSTKQYYKRQMGQIP